LDGVGDRVLAADGRDDVCDALAMHSEKDVLDLDQSLPAGACRRCRTREEIRFRAADSRETGVPRM
jgi:hypothetical protein